MWTMVLFSTCELSGNLSCPPRYSVISKKMWWMTSHLTEYWISVGIWLNWNNIHICIISDAVQVALFCYSCHGKKNWLANGGQVKLACSIYGTLAFYWKYIQILDSSMDFRISPGIYISSINLVEQMCVKCAVMFLWAKQPCSIDKRLNTLSTEHRAGSDCLRTQLH